MALLTEAFNGFLDFSIASKAPSDEILQSRERMKVTWYEFRTIDDGVGVPNLELQSSLPSLSVVLYYLDTTEQHI
ncbi:hypothetical protein TNCV_2421201 [Trichonephila clavipes]|nr:hypothetical protein TNCV_2421201 [Trichonephila clavipes]